MSSPCSSNTKPGGTGFHRLGVKELRRLAERRVDETIDPYFKKLFGYGPKDPRYLDCDDIDMKLAVYEYAVLLDDEKPENPDNVQTDDNAWEVAEKALNDGVEPSEIIRLYEEAAANDAQKIEEWQRMEGLLHDLLGDDYDPQPFPEPEEEGEEEDEDE